MNIAFRCIPHTYVIAPIFSELSRSGGSVVHHTLDYQSRGRKIDPPRL